MIEELKNKGAKIGKDVKIAKGVKFEVVDLMIGDGSVIGKNTSISGKKVHLGKMSMIGENVKLNCQDAVIGDLLYCADNVIIGGGGSNGPYSKLRMGRSCFIGPYALINTNREVSIGDDVCVGPKAMIYTHGHWQNVLEGYYAAHEPVNIKSNVWLGVNVIVNPGITIEKDTTINSGSVIINNIPANSLVMGNPAKILRNPYPNRPSKEHKSRILEKIMDDVKAQLDFKNYKIKKEKNKLISSEFVINFNHEKVNVNNVVFDLNKYEISGDQDTISDEVREVFRRYGVKFKPYLWRYKNE
jgi:acetyltransferase-like isoleucine patch superfamily enzyme